MSTVLYYREIQQKERKNNNTKMCFLVMIEQPIDWFYYVTKI